MNQFTFESMAGLFPERQPRLSEQEKKEKRKAYTKEYRERPERKKKAREHAKKVDREKKIGGLCQFDGCGIDDIDMLMIHHLFPDDDEIIVVLCANHHLLIDHFKEGFYKNE